MNAIEELLRGHIRGVREAIAEANSRADALEAMVDKFALLPPAPLATYRMNGWSKEEEAVLRDHYPLGGAVGCVALLPGRSYKAIRAHAPRLGLTTEASARRVFCEQCDARVTHGQAASCQSEFCKAKALIASGAA